MSLTGAINAFNSKVKDMASDEFRRRCVAIANDTIRNTPVDEGRLRANWQIDFVSMPTGEIEWKGGKDELANGVRAQSAAMQRIALAANTAKGATVCYITNNLPYAIPVEQGGPTNRPRRMLARAILRASKKL